MRGLPSACEAAAGDIGNCQSNAVEPAACQVQPDARIKRSGGPLRGNNVYNTNAVGQAVHLTPRAATVRLVYISIENDGSDADSFSLQVTGVSPSGYSVCYFRGRTTHEITSAVEAGTFTTPLLQPGQKFVIGARVVTSASAVKGSLFSRLFTFSSLGNDATQDAVRLNVKRR